MNNRRDDPEMIDLCIDSEDDTDTPISSKQSSTSSSFFSLRSRPFGSLSSRELSLYCLQRVFGFQSFRPGVQADVVQTCVDKPKSDIFVIMPTGGGKSICYAVPALLHPGVTVVVSPLLSLIQDQVTGFVSGSSSLQGHGIAAAHLSSEMTESEAVTLYRELFKAKNFPPRTADAIASSRVPQYPPIQLLPTCKLLFCTPEKLAKSSTLNEALLALYEGRHPVTNQRLLARFVIDEAHCVSEWGHDFRKDYLELSRLRRDFPDVQIMALTATATPTVRDDISRVLGMKNVSNFEQSFNRTNLIYSVRKKRNVKSEGESNGLQGKEALYAQVLDYITKEHGPTDVGIIYSLSRDDCEDLAIWLKLMGISADYYHAGMPSKQRVIVQNAWQSGKTRIIVATIAYGMGIDMPSVRFVVHFTIAKSVEGYFQESGRAGRDGQLAHCLLFYDKKDVDRVSRLLNMPQKGKTRATMAREEARLKQMQQFCEDTNKCRREFMINFFGQEFNKALCKGTCDNCYAASTFSSSSSSSSSTMMSAMSKKEKEWLRNHDKDALPSLPKESMASRMSIARSSGKGGSKAATTTSSGVKEGEIEKTSDDPFSDIFGGKKKTKSLSSSSSGRVSKKRARSKTPTDNGNDDANDIHVGVGKPKTKKKKNFWAGKNFWKSKSQGKKTKGIIYQRK